LKRQVEIADGVVENHSNGNVGRSGSDSEVEVRCNSTIGGRECAVHSFHSRYIVSSIVCEIGRVGITAYTHDASSNIVALLSTRVEVEGVDIHISRTNN